MIKSLKKYQVQLTPFEATKNWALNNTDNDNLLLTEDDYAIALEFIDYGDGSGLPYDNSLCDIALEQQGTDLATVEDGLYVTGPFYPDTDPSNVDGTYKRSIYYQVRTMFYNMYLDPTKIWGTENIDFELSKTKRILAEQFRLFDIPRIVFGDKMTPKSVTMTDNTLDNPYTVTDDGNGNMFAGTNLFSHQQELGEYGNEFIADMSSSLCDWYWANDIHIYGDTGSSVVSFFSGRIEDLLRIDTASVLIGFVYGTAQDFPYVEGATSSLAFYAGSVDETAFIIPITGSWPPDSSSMEVGFFAGNVLDTTQVISSSEDISTSSVAFFTGSYDLTTFPVTMSVDSSSRFEAVTSSVAFVSGSYTFTTQVLTMSFNQMTSNVAFYEGSCVVTSSI